MASSSEEIAYITTNSSAIADSIDGSVATFENKTILVSPPGFRNTKLTDFKVHLNNRIIPLQMVNYIRQEGPHIKVSVDIAKYLEIPNAVLEEGDEVLLTGKFS